MDVSKLPRLSGEKQATQPDVGAAPPDAPPIREVIQHTAAPAPVVGAEVWFSIVIGIVFLALGWSFGRYLGATLTHQPFHTNVKWMEGPPHYASEVAYWDLEGGTAWSESAMFLFGAALIVDALCLAVSAKLPGARRGWIMLSLAIMLSAVIYNLMVCLKLFNLGITPLISLLAVAFGGYAVFYQWAILRSLSPTSADSRFP